MTRISSPATSRRHKEILEAVASRPGVTIPEIAEAMAVRQNLLYRLLPELQAAGKVEKRGRGWWTPGDTRTADKDAR